MELKDLIHSEMSAEFKRITDRLKKPQLLPFLLNHERRPRMEEKVRLQIFGISQLRHNVELDKNRVLKIAQAGAQVFAKLAIEHVTKSHMSAAELQRQTKENSREQDAARWFEAEQKALKSTAISKSTYVHNGVTKEDSIQGSEEGAKDLSEAGPGPV